MFKSGEWKDGNCRHCRQFPYLDYQLQNAFFLLFHGLKSKYGNCRHCRQFPYFDYTETADIVASFRILIIQKLPTLSGHCWQFPYFDYQSKTHFFCFTRADNLNTETADIVVSFRIWIINCRTHFFPVSEPIIKVRKLPTLSAVSVFGLSTRK